MNQKHLFIPIITPLRSLNDDQFILKRNDEVSFYSSKKYYLCLKSLNTLKRSFNTYSEKILPAWSTGEGNKLDLELWKSLVYNSIKIFGQNKVIPAIIFPLERKGDILDAVEWICRKGKEGPVEFALNDAIIFDAKLFNEILDKIKGANKKIFLYLFHNCKKNADDIVKLINQYNKDTFSGIKDSRFDNNLGTKIKELNKAFVKSKIKIPIFEGWENRYNKTHNFVRGGILPIANLEPELLLDFVRQSKPQFSHAIESLFKKFGDGDNWVYHIKEEFNFRPTKCIYDDKHFGYAFDKLFESYSEEPLNNIHVKKFNPLKPLESVCRTAMSDLHSIQTMYFRYNDIGKNKKSVNGYFSPELLFIVTGINIENVKSKSPKDKISFILKKDAFISWMKILSEEDKTVFSSLFSNNYLIEELIYFRTIIKDSYSFNSQIIQPDPYFETHWGQKEINLFYEPDDKSEQLKLNVYYIINPKLNAEIPLFIFNNILRIALFTKRNKIEGIEKEKHATKAAIAAVMSRNMSHNIGSHVLSTLANLDSEKVEALQKKDYKTSSDWIDQSKIFYNYLQRRMEFIADISTAETIITNASFFQKDILDKFKTVGQGDDYPHFISDFISGVRNLNRKNIHIKGFLKKDNEVFSFDKEKNLDTLIDLPNDSLGAQALYVMLENIIRNATKHNKVENSLELNLYIEDSEVSPDYYEISIVDNQHKIHKEKYKRGKTKINLPPIINSTIKKPILENGKVRDFSWGILELKICAAYLAKEKLEEFDNIKIFDKPLIQAAYFDKSGNIDTKLTHFNFGYKFWLRKPKLVLIATDNVREFTVKKDKKGIETNIETKLNGKGIFFADILSIQKLIANGTEHEYLVLSVKESIHINIPSLGKSSSNQKIISIDSVNKRKLINILMSLSKDNTEIREFLIGNYYPDYAVKNITSGFENVKLDKNKIEVGEEGFKGSPRLVMKTNKGNVIFDHHSEAFTDNNLPKEFVFLEFCGTQSGTFEILSNSEKSSICLNEICSAALNRVVIFDERIQENTTDKEKLNLKQANIIIPRADKDVDLMEQSYDRDVVNREINKQLKQLPDYLIIHLGVIEKYLMATSEEEINRWINKKFKLENEYEEKSIEERTKLIIISGRGKPPTLPDRTFYFPYSLVAQCILPANQSSKLKLIQLLNKARRHERNRNNYN